MAQLIKEFCVDLVYRPAADYLSQAIRNSPHLCDAAYVGKYYPQCQPPPCVLPIVKNLDKRSAASTLLLGII